MAYRAIDKILDIKGMPESYVLQEDNGMIQQLSVKDIKSGIRYRKAHVYNLDLTRDNKLVYLEKYNMLGMCVPANEFFSYRYGSWQLTPPNNGEPVVMAYNYSNGKRIYVRVLASPDGTEYAMCPIQYCNRIIRINRISRHTIDSNIIPSALNEFSKLT